MEVNKKYFYFKFFIKFNNLKKKIIFEINSINL